MIDQQKVDTIADLGNEIKRKWLHEGRIVVYEARSVTRSAVDIWADAVLADARNWPEDRPLLALHDFIGQGLTPYNRRRAEEIGKQFPEKLRGRYAVVISPGLVGKAIRFFGKVRLKQTMPNMESEYFFDYDTALAWLEELLA